MILLCFLTTCTKKVQSKEFVGKQANTEAEKLTCEQLPTSFTSYEQAHSLVKSATYAYVEIANTSRSHWILGASYYSCDGKVGYYFIKTASKEYIYKDMPIEIWKGFLAAPSLGSYYNQFIKKRYQLYLEKPS